MFVGPRVQGYFMSLARFLSHTCTFILLSHSHYLSNALLLPYSGLFSWVQILVGWPSEFIFMVLNFLLCARMRSQIIETRVIIMDSNRERTRGRRTMERFSVESCVRGYHVYKDIWTASVGEELSCLRVRT